MSKGKTAICVCAMVASCVTGSVFIADSAMSGHTVGKMNNKEVFSFENQQLSNAMPTFTTPIGETTETIKADTCNYTQTIPAIINSQYVAETTTHETQALYTQENISQAFITEQAVTTTVTPDYDENNFTEVVTTATTMAVTTEITTTAYASEEVAITTTTTTIVNIPEATATTSEISIPSDWFFMETQPVQIMDTEPVDIEPICTTTSLYVESVPETTTTTTVYTEPVTETTTTTTVYTEPVTETTTTTTTTIFTEPVTETTTVYTEPIIIQPVVTEPVYTQPVSYISESDYILLCNAVAHEAGSDWIDVYSKANVVEVIMNRVNSPLFPNTIYDVLSQPYQFEGSETYTSLGYYSYEVTDSVKSAVDLYFNEPYSFCHGYLFFYGDGYQNHFSVAQ